jgi:hypothetical protein
MASRPDGYRPVEALGTLRLDTPSGRSLNLVANGEGLRLEVPDLQEARAIMPRSFRGRRRALRFLAELFSTHGLIFSLESGGTPVFRFGHGVAPSWLARLLGLAPANIPFSAIGLLFRR